MQDTPISQTDPNGAIFRRTMLGITLPKLQRSIVMSNFKAAPELDLQRTP
jgi:hypothetical protein